MMHQRNLSDHPLRYSQYVRKDKLLQHLNDLEIDQSDIKKQQTKKKLNTIRIHIPYPKQQIHQIDRQQFVRSIHTREYMQVMNKKLKQMRISRYTSLQNPQEKRHWTAHGFRYEHVEQDELIPQVKGVATSLQVNKTSTNFRTSKKKKQERLKIDPTKQSKSINISPINFNQPPSNNKNEVIPQIFKSKLKKKCVQDNLNIMASMIKKKIKVLNKKQMYEYINHLMTRNNK